MRSSDSGVENARDGHLRKLASAVLVLASGGVTLRYLFIALGTFSYSEQLEWMEGETLHAILRVRDGAALYAEPSIEYVSLIYTPLYFWTSAAVSYLTGPTLTAPRLVSLVSIVVAGLLLGLITFREAKSRAIAMVAPGFFFATFDLSGQWLHLARVDSMFLALFLASAYVLRNHATPRGDTTAGLLMGLCFLAKQSALMALFPVGVFLLLHDWRRCIRCFGTMGAIVVSSVGVLEWMSDGWFTYYAFELPRSHGFIDEAVMGFWSIDSYPVLVSLLLAPFGIAREVRQRDGLLVAFLLGAGATAWTSRMHSGGYVNVLIPWFAWLAVFLALGMAWFAKRRERLVTDLVYLGTTVVTALQLIFLVTRVPMDTSFPPAGAELQAQRFDETLRATPGEVLFTHYRGLLERAGKRSHGLGMAGIDVLRSTRPDDRGRRALLESFEQALASQRFSFVITSDNEFVAPIVNRHYRYSHTLEYVPPRPVTGWTIIPKYVWVPRGTAPPPNQ